MFLFNIQTKNNEVVRFERDANTNKIAVDKISMIKAVRQAMCCSLKDSKDFCDLFVAELNKMATSPDLVRIHIQDELNTITNSDDLLDVLRFVRTTKDHPVSSRHNWPNN